MKAAHWIYVGLAAAVAGLANINAQAESVGTEPVEPPRYVKVIAAPSIIDAVTVTTDGRSAGEIEYLLIDSMNGAVEYAILSENGALALALGEYIVIPFSTLKLEAADDDQVQLSLTLQELEAAPRFNDDSLNTLTDPTAVTSVYQYFEPILARREDTAQSTTPEVAANTPRSASSTPANGKSRARLLVSRRIVRSLLPGLDFAENYVDAEIELRDGELFGTVDQIIISQSTGDVAYYLVEHGGFLGIGSEWFAMPAGSLSWSAEQFAFIAPFENSADALRFESIPKDQLPSTVRQRDLDQLYRSYGMKNAAGQPAADPTASESES